MKHPANMMRRPPPAYPASAKEKEEIFDYMAKHSGFDPRLAYSIGQPAWSIWFHVTDPAAMTVIHGLVVLVTFLFTIGLCTRVTSVLTWMTSLWYIHRNPVLLFGVDTMMVILLLYLMIGPSGAALSVDRLIARWWSKAKPRVVNRWRSAVWPARRCRRSLSSRPPTAPLPCRPCRPTSLFACSRSTCASFTWSSGLIQASGSGLVERNGRLGHARQLRIRPDGL